MQGVIVVWELWDAICDNIVGSGNAICIDPHWLVDHEGTLEDVKGFSHWWLFSSLLDPCFGSHIVGEE